VHEAKSASNRQLALIVKIVKIEESYLIGKKLEFRAVSGVTLGSSHGDLGLYGLVKCVLKIRRWNLTIFISSYGFHR
jgi:hypothetical protein